MSTKPNPEQLIRELAEALKSKCPLCVEQVPFDQFDLAYYKSHWVNRNCKLLKTEHDLIKQAEAYLMDL